MGIRLCTVILQCRIIYYDYSVCSICSKSFCLILDVGSDQYCCYIYSKVICKLLSLADQLKCDTSYDTVYLLSEYKYALIFTDIHNSFHLVLIRLHASPAALS